MSYRIVGSVLCWAAAFAAFTIETSNGALMVAPETQQCTLAGLNVQISEKGTPYAYGLKAKCPDGIYHLDSATGLRATDISKLHYDQPIACNSSHKIGYWSKVYVPFSEAKICSAQ